MTPPTRLKQLDSRRRAYAYACLAHELTIIGRMVCDDSGLTEKAAGQLRSLNEIMHRLLGGLMRCLSKPSIDASIDESLARLITEAASQYGWAREIEHAWQRSLSLAENLP